MAGQVAEARQLAELYAQDEASLTSYMHAMRAAREDADKSPIFSRTRDKFEYKGL